MSAFASFDASASGLRSTSTWLDRIAHNVANMHNEVPSDAEPFRAQHPVFVEDGAGVTVAGFEPDGGDPALVYAPDDPNAGPDGYVARAVVDLSGEMTDMIVAQRAYQSNLSMVQAARERYQAAMRIGR